LTNAEYILAHFSFLHKQKHRFAAAHAAGGRTTFHSYATGAKHYQTMTKGRMATGMDQALEALEKLLPFSDCWLWHHKSYFF